MTDQALPRRVSSPTDLAGVVRALSDLQDQFRLSPLVEIKEVNFIAGTLSTNPLRVSTKIKRPQVVFLGGAWLSTNAAESVTPTGFHWRRGNAGEVLVDALSGLNTGSEYTLALHIEGGR